MKGTICILILGIIGLIAARRLAVSDDVILTFRWLKNKIQEKFADKNVEKVAVADLDKLIESCNDTVNIDELKKLSDKGYTHLIVTVDVNGNVNDVEVIRNISDTIDEEVDHLINRTGEGIVVVNR